MKLDQIDGDLCTHLVLASAKIDSNGLLSLSSSDTIFKSNDEFKRQVINFKRKFPQVKVMISVLLIQSTTTTHHQQQQQQASQPTNTSCQPSSKTSLSDSDKRQKFAKSAIEFLQFYNLDGLDLNFEFSIHNSISISNQNNFVVHSMIHSNSREYNERVNLIKLCNSLREAIIGNFYNRQITEQHQLNSQQSTIYQHTVTKNSNPISKIESYLLTLFINGSQETNILKSSSYRLFDFKQLINFIDWFNVKSFDYFLFKPYTPFTGPNSPLYSIVEPYVPILSKLSFNYTLNRLLIEDEVPKEKIIMGIPTFGRAYKLMFKNNQPAPFTLAVGARLSARSSSSSITSNNDNNNLKMTIDNNNNNQSVQNNNSTTNVLTNEHFLIDYKEVCDILKRSDTIVDFDPKARVPYLLTDDGYTWLSFENIQSVREKVRTIVNYGLAGYMTCYLNTDNATTEHCETNTNNAPSNGSSIDTDNNNNNNSPPSASPLDQQSPKQQQNSNFPLHRAMLEEISQSYMSSQSSKLGTS